MNRQIFPYGIKFQEDARIEVFPAAEIFVSGRNGHGMRTIFHIDSGATTSVMPEGDAKTLGLRKEEGELATVRGITREILSGRRRTITLHINNTILKVPVIFLGYEETPRILGREGLFAHFGILFDEFKRRTAFIENRSERKVIDNFF